MSYEDFQLLRDQKQGEKIILAKLAKFERNRDYLSAWEKFSRLNGNTYPSQGILKTPYDYLDYCGIKKLDKGIVIKTLRMRRFFLEMFNHTDRVSYLYRLNKQRFIPPPRVRCKSIEIAKESGISLSVGDFGAVVTSANKNRVSRTERYAHGPFVKLGRQARTFFVGSASPDVWNSAAAIATMAMSHCLAGIPRNGVTSDIKRQADLAYEAISWIRKEGDQILKDRDDKSDLLKMWQNNLMGTLEANCEKAVERCKALFEKGVRTFRIYSPEPGNGSLETLTILRKIYKNDVEIFVGQVVDVHQAKAVEKAGADGIFLGIGGGGRCITGVRSGLVIDWPDLTWDLRGEIKIPIIIEGGASDHIATSLLLGASGISVSRVANGGTIESPGGYLYCVDSKGRFFKPYGGEASARTKYLDKKLMPFDIPSFVEGETTAAYKSYITHALPTLVHNLHILTEDAILALVFRGVNTLSELHAINPSPLRQITGFGEFQRNTH